MIVAEGEEKGCGPKKKGNWFLKMEDEEVS